MIEIACAADRAFLPHSATMVASALENAGAPVRIHVLAGPDVGRRDRRRMTRMVRRAGGEIEIHRVRREELRGLKVAGPFPAAVWYRVALPQLLGEVDRVLYIDSDALVVGSLIPLWGAELGDAWLAAVTNVFPSEEFGRVHCRGLGLDDATYFNSGVLLLDLKRLRAADSLDRVREFAVANHARLVFPDQDALNGALGDQRLPLHPRWNLMMGTQAHAWSASRYGPDEVRSAIEDPAILHFEGAANKPWLAKPTEMAGVLWGRYRSSTPWASRD
jgi:lipopolysaccharide biosynthesis glycosyltransferase